MTKWAWTGWAAGGMHAFVGKMWSYDHMIIWTYGHMIIWSHDHTIIWSYDHIFIWSYDHMIIWSYDHIIIRSHFGSSHWAQGSRWLKFRSFASKRIARVHIFAFSRPVCKCIVMRRCHLPSDDCRRNITAITMSSRVRIIKSIWTCLELVADAFLNQIPTKN